MTAETSTITAPEDRGDPQLVQEVRRLVTAGDRTALFEYVTAPPPAELAGTAAWFAKGGRALLAQDLDWRIHHALSADESRLRSLVRQLVTVSVSAPADAARFLPWREMAWSRNVDILMLLDVLVAKGGDWCRRFVAAAISRNAKAGERTAPAVVRHCLPLILHFGLSTADFGAYPRLWAFYCRELMGGRIHEVWNDEIAARFEHPGWSGVEFRIGPYGQAVVFPKMQKSLLELWDQDATAGKTLLRCFEVPDALGPLAIQFMSKEWTVGAAVRGYLDRGTYSREEVLTKLRAALARDDRLPSQRVLADVLESYQPGPEEVTASIPVLLSTVATAPGFLSDLALGLLLGVPLDGADLQDLGVAVFGRTRKKPQELLVRHLKTLQASGTYDADVLTACWEAAAGSSDLLIRTKAEEVAGLTGALICDDPQSAPSLWGTGVRQPPRVPPYVAHDADPERALERWSGPRGHAMAEEQYIDRFLRTVYRSPVNMRDWYRSGRARYFPEIEYCLRSEWGPLSPEPTPSWRRWADPDPKTALAMWASGEHDLAAHRNLTGLVRASLSRPSGTDDPFRWSSPLAAVRIFRQSELMVQAGTVPYSLATPGYDNFRVDLRRLVPLLRLFEREGWAYGEADLFQALLRLGPLDAQLAADIPELGVRPLDGPYDPERLAGRILRDWVGRGGFKAPPVDAPLTLPVSLDRFPSIPRELLSAELWSGGGRTHLGTWLGPEASAVVPFWPDLGAVWLDRGLVCGGLIALRTDGPEGATAGELRPLAHNWFVEILASPRQEDRDSAVKTVLELAARGQVSAVQLAMAVRKRVEADVEPLGRLGRSLALMAYEGHLDCAWLALTTLVVAASGQQKLPAGTAELLATCTELWDSIPVGHRTGETVPADFTRAVLALAASKSATKTRLEAGRLAARMGLVA